MACYYGISRKERFGDYFGNRWIEGSDVIGEAGAKAVVPRKTKLANTFYVLRLDFSGLSHASTFEGFNRSLNNIINGAISDFCYLYPDVENPIHPGKPPFTVKSDSVASFTELFMYIEHKGLSVCSHANLIQYYSFVEDSALVSLLRSLLADDPHRCIRQFPQLGDWQQRILS